MERQNLNQNNGLNKALELSQNKDQTLTSLFRLIRLKLNFMEIYVLMLHMILKVQRVQLRIRQDQYH